MFILGDETKHRGIPWVTITLVLLNLFVFLLQLGIGDPVTRGLSLVPAEITSGKDLIKPATMRIKQSYRDYYPGPDRGKVRYREVEVTVPQARGPRPIYLTLITSMFLHGSWLHLIGNMWFLLVFGRNVELAMGRGLFIAFYLTCGVVAGLADVLVMPKSVVPYLGASGAISGVMGAYFFIFPLNKVKVWIAYLYVVEVPSFIAVGLWFVIQYTSTAFAVTSGEVHSGIAYWSHLGGFLAGIAFIVVTLAILKCQQKQQRLMDELTEEEQDVEAARETSETPPPSEADELFARAERLKEIADPYSRFLPEPVKEGRKDESPVV